MNSSSGRLAGMPSLSHPLQFLLVALAGWINQRQRDVIDYLQEENRILRERLGELTEMWKLGRETVRLLVKEEEGVIKIRLGRKRAQTICSVPESMAVRIHTRLLNSR